MAPPFRFQIRQQVRKARPFEHCPSAPLAHLDPIIVYAISLSLELHVDATASRVDSNAVLRGGNLDYHASLI